MKKLLFIFGTRPEAIKMAPLIREFSKYPSEFSNKVCITAQHRKMLDQVLDFFNIIPDFDLNLMTPNQSLHALTANIISSLKPIFDEVEPDYVFVHGDTTTALAASLAAFYSNIKVCHVEAGLRTFNKQSPFPEEINRVLVSKIADLHFAPTSLSRLNLLNDSISDQNILVTGNTVIDALYMGLSKIESEADEEIKSLKEILDFSLRIILITGHRRENHGDGIKNICLALKKIADTNKDVLIVYPVHLNPNVSGVVSEYLSKVDNIKLIHPLAYPAFIFLLEKAYFIITDSGGIQEEAPSLGKPVLVLRDTTERPEAIDSSTVKLVGTKTENIIREAQLLLDSNDAYDKMAKANNPYGDGKASKRIVECLRSGKLIG